MATYIDGIAASENIDSSGERISVAGMDISSLPVDGVFNYEHESKHPDQVVGKVLFAKKIFSEKDCDDDRQRYFWDKCQVPYVYVMGELFDDYKDSAREVAGMFRYDADKKEQNERNVMNFSIEGAKIDKQGIEIVKSIARKVTITVLPCNKAAVAEMVPAQTKKSKGDIDGLFKTETTVEIELLKVEDMGKFLENLKKSAPTADLRGTHMGTTKSGKPIFSHERIGNYQGFSSHDHKEAMNFHYNAAHAAKDPKVAQHHTNKMKLHMQASQSAERRESRLAGAGSTVKAGLSTQPKPTASVVRPYGQVGDIKKAMTAGSGMAAPGSKVQGAALAKECVDPKLHKGCTHGDLSKAGEKGVHAVHNPAKPGQSRAGKASELEQKYIKDGNVHKEMHAKMDRRQQHVKAYKELKNMPKPNLTKSDYWLERAQEEYAKWDKREQFIQFMSKNKPNMTKTEIDVVGQTIALKLSLDAEKTLADFLPEEVKKIK